MQYGRLILKYELLKESFLLLKVKITPLKHWSYNCDWQIAKVLHDMVHDKSDVYHFLKKECNIDVSANEVMIVDAKRWINIHAYVMKYWKHVPILLMLEWIVVGAISINIKAQITKPNQLFI